MKTSQKSKSFFSKFKASKPVINRQKQANDDLIVIRDVSSGKDYYLSVIDTFVIAKQEYVVMYNYEPDNGNHHKPELVIMRSVFTDKGNQQFLSIKDEEELDRAFNCFIRRYYESKGSNKYGKNTSYKSF